MRRILFTGAYMGALVLFALTAYEVTAKSPQLIGQPLPGWQACLRAEQSTRWDPRTGILPLDHFLHEGEEALAFYGLRSVEPRPLDPGPVRSRLSSRSRSSAR